MSCFPNGIFRLSIAPNALGSVLVWAGFHHDKFTYATSVSQSLSMD